MAGVPLAGGLVGYAPTTSCATSSACRRTRARRSRLPDAALRRAASLLVFDHLTRGIALLHAGIEAERQSAAPRGDPRAARRLARSRPGRRSSRAPEASSYARRSTSQGVQRTQEYIAAGDVYQLVLSVRFAGRIRSRSLRGLSRAAAAQPLSLHVLLRARRRDGRRLLARGAGEAQRAGRRSCVRSPARGRAATTPPQDARARGGAARRPEGKRRARDAGRPRAQRPRPRRARRAACTCDPYRVDRALQPRDAHRERREGRARARAAMPSTCSPPTFPAGTLVGAPKVRAMEIIDELEPVRRGLYGGTVGYFGARGDMDQAITIRTLVFRGDDIQLPGGRRHRRRQRARRRNTTRCSPRARRCARALELAEEGL